MQPYVFFSILAAISFALSTLIIKFTSKHRISNSWVLLFYYYLGLVPSLFLIPLIFKVDFPEGGWVFVVLYAFAFFLGSIFFTKALYRLDASTIAPFYHLQSLFIIILAFFFLNERFSFEKYLFGIMMIIGSLFITLDEKMNIKTYFKIGVLLIVMQQFFHAISNIFAGFALKQMNSFTFIFWGDLVAVSFVFLLIPFVGASKFKVSFNQIKPLFISGFFSTIGATSLFTAFMFNITISSILSLLASPIVFVLAVIASIVKPNLLEHHSLRVYIVRGIGFFLILFGAINLSV